MNDMRAVIVPKSDQINADTLLGAPMTITVAAVDIRPGTEQPVSIHFDGDDGKPYKPCKSMCRVMVACWGPDANAYVGRSMTLYCDPKVMWGGMAVGGIRISHMSHLEGKQVMALTATKGNKKPFVVQPLKLAAPEQAPAPDAPKADKTADAVNTLIARINACENEDALHEIAGDAAINEWRSKLKAKRSDLEDKIAAAMGDRYTALTSLPDDTTQDQAA